jgi:hypothetical protein
LTHSNYDFTIAKAKGLKKITIDPSGLMADVKQENNVLNNKRLTVKLKHECYHNESAK